MLTAGRPPSSSVGKRRNEEATEGFGFCAVKTFRPSETAFPTPMPVRCWLAHQTEQAARTHHRRCNRPHSHMLHQAYHSQYAKKDVRAVANFAVPPFRAEGSSGPAPRPGEPLTVYVHAMYRWVCRQYVCHVGFCLWAHINKKPFSFSDLIPLSRPRGHR